MSDRRAQWLRLYEAALTGTVGPARGMASVSEGDAIVAAAAAARIADAAMARLDARDFPPSKVEALVSIAREIDGSGYLAGYQQEALSKALASLEEKP